MLTIALSMRSSPPTDLYPYFRTFAEVVPASGGTLELGNVFPNTQPVELDVGSGRGLFLVAAGEANPHTNYLGIEIDYREGRRAARRLQRRRLDNVRVLGGDAQFALQSLIRPQSLAAVHVYFPDPWWKRKHRRRRVFTDRFVDACAGALKVGGLLHAWTDVADYFDVMAALMDHHLAFDKLPPPDERPAAHDMDFHTSFERKKRKDGHPIYRGRWRRRDSDC